MRDGIYFVQFTSDGRNFDAGIVVVRDNTVNGGDVGFTYQGRIQDGRLNLGVSRHNPSVQNIIEGVNNYVMVLSVKESSGNYVLEGRIADVPGANLIVHAKFIGGLI